MDLKQGMEVLRANKTFREILSTLLSIGIFLNGTEVITNHCCNFSRLNLVDIFLKDFAFITAGKRISNRVFIKSS